MSIIREFTLYLHAGITTPEVIHANQYSQGETWIFKLLQDDGSVYVPSTGALIGVKADGHAIAGLTGTVLGDGRVSITTTQQLTAAAGDATCELTIDGGTNGSANFVIRVEKKPTDDAILSESDLSIIQEGLNSVTPAAINESVSNYLEENLTDPPIDPTLSISNAAADAKVTGDKLTELKTALNILYDDNTYTVPKILEDLSVYASATGGGDVYISNRTIPEGYTLDKFYCYSSGTSNGYIYVIDKTTSKVLYRKAVSFSTGVNNVVVGYLCPSDCYFGVRGSKAYTVNKGTDRTTYGDYEFGTDGLYQPSTATIQVGDTLTINKTSSNVILFTMSFTYSIQATGLVPELYKTAVIVTSATDTNNLLRYSLIDDTVGYLGRWFDYNGKKCTNNDGSEFFFKTKNTSLTQQIITIVFGQITVQEVTPYYAVSIDGGDFVRKQITNNTITLSAESTITNEHIIRIVIDGMTESQGGSKYQGQLGVYIDSISVNVGSIIGIYPKCKIGMFLGDSITEGINALGVGANASVNSAVNAYPYFCCKKLGAVSYRVGYGGTGMVVTGSFRSCEYALEYYYTGKHVGQFMVDFVVINHGINDYNNSVSTSDFKSAYENVINVLRAKFGAIPIFCVTPFNNAYDEQIQEVANSYDNCYYISSDGWNGETVDGTHLSADGAKNNGELLADAILPVLGKSYFIN